MTEARGGGPLRKPSPFLLLPLQPIQICVHEKILFKEMVTAAQALKALPWDATRKKK